MKPTKPVGAAGTATAPAATAVVAAAKTPADHSAGSEMSEESLAALLAAEDAEPGPDAGKTKTEKANGGDESPVTEGSDGPEGSAEESEAKTDDLSQAENQTEEEEGDEAAKDGEAADEGAVAETEDADAAIDAEEAAEVEERIASIEHLTDEQKTHVSDLIRERVAKAVAKHGETKDRLAAIEAEKAALETKVSELEAGGASVPVVGDGPFAEVTSLEVLQKKAWNAKSIVDFCEDQLLEVDLDPAAVEQRLRSLQVVLKNGEGEEDFSPARMKAYLGKQKRDSQQTLQRDIPNRAKWIQQEQAASAHAAKVLPWLKDAKHPNNAKLNELVKADPTVKRHASWKFILGLAVDRLVMLDAEEKAKGKPAKPPLAQPKKLVARPAILPKTTKAKPEAGKGESTRLKTLRENFERTGSPKDLELLEAAGG